MRRRKKVFKVLFVGQSKEIRERAIKYFNEHLARKCIAYSLYVVSRAYRVSSVASAQRIIGKCPSFELIVFPPNFPEEEVEQLREWLSLEEHLGIPFAFVPIERPVAATQSLMFR